MQPIVKSQAIDGKGPQNGQMTEDEDNMRSSAQLCPHLLQKLQETLSMLGRDRENLL